MFLQLKLQLSCICSDNMHAVLSPRNILNYRLLIVNATDFDLLFGINCHIYIYILH